MQEVQGSAPPVRESTVLFLQVFYVPEGAGAAFGARTVMAFARHGARAAAAAFCAAGGYARFLIFNYQPDDERDNDDQTGAYQYCSEIGSQPFKHCFFLL
jgi:hypothetical protein